MLEIQALLFLALSAVLFGAKVFALVDCVARKPSDIERASQVSKNGWLIILALSIAWHVITWNHPIGLLNLAGTVAAFVYLAQLRGSNY
ncbi:MAG: DUF2516 family protein [Aeromicrobium sp.]